MGMPVAAFVVVAALLVAALWALAMEVAVGVVCINIRHSSLAMRKLVRTRRLAPWVLWPKMVGWMPRAHGGGGDRLFIWLSVLEHQLFAVGASMLHDSNFLCRRRRIHILVR
jgi:hypothetical protein